MESLPGETLGPGTKLELAKTELRVLGILCHWHTFVGTELSGKIHTDTAIAMSEPWPLALTELEV